MLYTKTNSKWITKQNVRAKIIKFHIRKYKGKFVATFASESKAASLFIFMKYGYFECLIPLSR